MGAVMRSSSCPWLVWCVVCTASRVGASCQRGRPAVRGAGQLSGAAPTDGGPNIYTLFRHRDGTPVTRHTWWEAFRVPVIMLPKYHESVWYALGRKTVL